MKGQKDKKASKQEQANSKYLEELARANELEARSKSEKPLKFILSPLAKKEREKKRKKLRFLRKFRRLRKNLRRHRITVADIIYQNISTIFAWLVVLVLFAIAISIIINSIPAFEKFGFSFLISTKWDSGRETFGALNAIYGSIIGAIIAMAIAVPISVGIAIFLTELAHKHVKTVVGVAVELLAAIPSIVYGMVGLIFLVPLVAKLSSDGTSIGVGILSASIVLSIMVLPFMASLMRDSIDATPDMLKESAYGLGATRFEVVKDVVFPYAKTGVVGSMILALSRVLGETMAVALLIGGTQKIPASLIQPATNIPSTIAINFGEAGEGIYSSSLFYLALVLLVLNFIIIFIAKKFINKKGVKHA
ncbi:phosphate ABC transporter permease subunit PstC [Helicobacter sp. 13S00401-1]|uniref:phosphate ABC transporter permease subunit PstC n=1 Tax=Helicobacter sp. 13S00401-1 TaxID=1905758 RepID=UPI000BA52766|nr:phosphate ABC transporter permease subunit PstC [Helicobacter sp. 13S00401-1]